MMGYTHAAAGAFAGALAGKLTGDPVAGMAVGAVAALLPDIDHPGSIAGRRLRPVAVLLEFFAGHRTVTHTVWFCAGAALLVAVTAGILGACVRPYAPWWPAPWEAGACALLGGLSHLVLDACTGGGVRPLDPLPVPGRLAWLEHVRGPLVTGDPLVELPATVLFALGAARLAGIL